MSGQASKVSITVFGAMVQNLDWITAQYLCMAENIESNLLLGQIKKRAHFIRVIKIFIAPKTIYFSAASATENNISWFMVITDGCLYRSDSAEQD